MPAPEKEPSSAIALEIHPLSDSYDDFLLKYQVLEEMGYPIRFRPVDSFDFFANNIDDPYEIWRSTAYHNWVEPLVSNLEFKDWSRLEVNERQIANRHIFEALLRHPIAFLEDITLGYPSILKMELENHQNSIKNNTEPTVETYDPDINIEHLIEAMFLAAHDQAKFLLQSDYPAYNVEAGVKEQAAVEYYEEEILNCEEYRRELLSSGRAPITSDYLKVIIRDFIIMLEVVSDEFVAFKNP